MAIYRYALHDDAGANEHLGFIEIPSDSEAIAFGREVLADLLQNPDHGRASLEITEGGREVASIPLQVEVREKAYG